MEPINGHKYAYLRPFNGSVHAGPIGRADLTIVLKILVMDGLCYKKTIKVEYRYIWWT